MNRGEAKLKGLPWANFKDIPQGLRNIYSLILALSPYAYEVVMSTNTYEMCCEYWFNNQLFKATGHLLEEE